MLSSKTGLAVKAMVAAGICFGSTSAMAAKAVRPNAVLTSAMTTAAANPCPVGMQGCVLPLPEPVAAPTPQPAPAPAAYVPPAASSGGFSLLPILIGIGAIAGLAFLLLDDDDGAVSA